MAIITYGVLFPPYVALVSSSSIDGIKSVRTGIIFGVVDAVNVYNSLAHVGDSCMFKSEDAMLVTAGGTSYYIIDEINLVLKEVVLP